MTDIPQRKKPKTVLNAEYALWIWTAWTCLFGLYQSWISIPDLENMMASQLQGIVAIAPETLKESIVGGYALLAVTSLWVIIKIGAGKNWARVSLLLGFILDVVWSAMPPHHGLQEYLADVPDLGLQSYALYLLYTWPGERWFKEPLN